MHLNPLTQLDFYKTGHIRQYPEGLEEVYLNFTARGDSHAPVLRKGSYLDFSEEGAPELNLQPPKEEAAFDGDVVFFGLQGFIKEFLLETFNAEFFEKTEDDVANAWSRRMRTSLGEGVVGEAHIRALHKLGYLPLEIRALPEGSRVPLRVPMYTVHNTHPEFGWLPGHLEDVLSNMLWKPTTVATVAYQYRKLVNEYAALTGGAAAVLASQVHDFSSRGMSGPEDSSRTSPGHGLSFTGTDAVGSLDYIERYYNADAEKELLGEGVPATEHSVMCLGGFDTERETYRRLIEDVYPTGIVSIVSDTWDYWNVILNILPSLKDVILARKPNERGLAKLVIRPDSGDPVRIVCGYFDSELVQGVYGPQEFKDADGSVRYMVKENKVMTPNGVEWEGRLITAHERKGTIECLWDLFGGTVNACNFKELHERIGVLYGDGITLKRAQEIFERLRAKGFASTCVFLGAGSYAYQYISRDSFGIALKATSGVVNGERVVLEKNPKTDSGVKRSARGLLRVERDNGTFVLHEDQTEEQAQGGAMRVVFKNGALYNETSFREVRKELGQIID